MSDALQAVAEHDGDYILTIDAGNTRMKWGVFSHDGQLQSHGACLNSELSQYTAATEFVPVWQQCRQAILSNVAGPHVQHAITALLQQSQIPLHLAKASAHACNVSNGYEKPEMLGTDRWAALLAAWNQHRNPCLVINAGTALTIDALSAVAESSKGQFLGGMILPGLRLMQQSLVNGTAGIAAKAGTLQDFPANTADAMQTGALNAMVGAVMQMLVKLQQHVDMESPLGCIISGGDAVLLAAALGQSPNIDVHIDHHLVLKGLLLLERDAE